MKKILTQLQDAAYELEGLLMLALAREERQESISPLVLEKISAITELGDELRKELFSKPMTENSLPAEDNHVDENYDVEEDNLQAGNIEEIENYSCTMPDAEEERVFSPGTLPDAFTETVAEPEKEKVKNSTRRPVFCINDRFLFIRELFGNSSAAFDRAMDKVATMDSIEEAENFFISESGWDSENENVIRFMETLDNYFQQD